MLKALGTLDGHPLVVLGLTDANVAQLVADRPIRLDLAELGLPATTILIVAGRDQQAIVKKLEDSGLARPGMSEQIVEPRPGERRVVDDRPTGSGGPPPQPGT